MFEIVRPSGAHETDRSETTVKRTSVVIAVLVMAPTIHAESLALSLAGVMAVQEEAESTPAGTGGEFFVSGYLGNSWIADSDLTVSGTSFNNVDWDTKPWTMPIYYGARFGYWFEQDSSGFGLMLDFTHAKAIASATSIGAPLTAFEMTHGINYLTLNVMYRNFPNGRRDDSFMGRVQPYVGAGVGVAIPHVEAAFGGVPTSEYQLTGPVAQVLVGFNFDIAGPLIAFIEYKFNYSDISVDLNGGGKVDTDIVDHQLIVGFGLRF